VLCSWLEGVLDIAELIAESFQHPYWLHIADILGLGGPGQQPYLPKMDKATFSLVFSQK